MAPGPRRRQPGDSRGPCSDPGAGGLHQHRQAAVLCEVFWGRAGGVSGTPGPQTIPCAQSEPQTCPGGTCRLWGRVAQGWEVGVGVQPSSALRGSSQPLGQGVSRWPSANPQLAGGQGCPGTWVGQLLTAHWAKREPLGGAYRGCWARGLWSPHPRGPPQRALVLAEPHVCQLISGNHAKWFKLS